MEARSDRENNVRDWVISTPNTIHAAHELGGPGMLALTGLLAPKPKQVRRMLLELRRHHRWSQGFAASVLGVGKSSVTKWETKWRNPCGSAAKLIFLLHYLLIKKKKNVNCFDLATWGQLPGVSVPEAAKAGIALELNSTYFIPNEQMIGLMEKPNIPPAEKEITI